MIPIHHFLYLGALLFCAGLAVALTKKNAIVVMIGIELMLNGANVNLVAFSQSDPFMIQGQVFALFVMVIAAAEATIALAIIIRVFHHFQTADLDQLNELRD
jgi:NADH-quinone oxidoreductase subunit K